ncbi:glutathione peroxidase [Sulfurospirillum diekertiae]|uniref:Glutathione peroxidase n=1 Tax=Sulfurospirillum diekertiae TaxID=1854492 RepID=A0A290HAM5_9BACT|nr:glutathione peroxidase [Sulfurospirillum diekertiae]ATB68465.1 Glutathione peroxidase BsaA [Sulfurospirillum diekertiae]QIR76321.1 glutathione peroxidase [Sulfurospirillum diekertiae]QIR78951.1 glutathione peroxidase [Sulfurospirillum diekertiae]
MSIYDFEVKTINGETISMNMFQNKVLLIVNVASKCGFTNQYEGLENLYEKYKDKGFTILGFPCNQFMNQEPLSEDDIKSFCSITYGVTFPMFAKIDVNGEHTHPLYAYLKEAQKGLLGIEAIKWNFTKFLVDKNGVVVNRFAPATKPESLELDILLYL